MPGYPSLQDYQEALQNPGRCFADRELASGVPILDSLGLPRPLTGAAGVVFKVRATAGSTYATKCFSKDVPDLAQRYRAIDAALRGISGSWPVKFEYQDQGIRVLGRLLPLLKMEWVNGPTLASFVERNRRNPAALRSVADEFSRVVGELEAAGLAHGDLQHGNIIIDETNRLRLIDYDGMYVPSIRSLGGIEKGHPNYQLPSRRQTDYNSHLDRFSAWVIYTSLIALTYDPTIWDISQGGDDCLILRAADFAQPRASAVLIDLGRSGHEPLLAIARLLSELAGSQVATVPALDPSRVVLSGGTSAALAATPWWQGRSIQQILPTPSVAVPTHATEQSRVGAGWLISHLDAGPRRFPLLRLHAAFLYLAVTGLSVLAVWLAILGVLAWLPSAVAGGGMVGVIGVSYSVYRRRPERSERIAARTALARCVAAERAAAQTLRDRRAQRASLLAPSQSMTQELAGLMPAEQAEAEGVRRTGTDELAGLAAQRSSVECEAAERLDRRLKELQHDHMQQRLRQATLLGSHIDGVPVDELRRASVHGIVTAADFTGYSLESYSYYGQSTQKVNLVCPNGSMVHIHGIGPVRSERLKRWRDRVVTAAETSQPTHLPSAELAALRAQGDQKRAAIDAQIVRTRQRIEGEVGSIRSRFASKRADLQRRIAEEQRSIDGTKQELEQSIADIDRQTRRLNYQLDQHRAALNKLQAVTFAHYLSHIARLPSLRYGLLLGAIMAVGLGSSVLAAVLGSG